jgi:cell division septation protein DedD
MRPALRLALALVLGVACAALLACGGGTNPKLLPGTRADNLQTDLDGLRNAVDNGQCADATRALTALRAEVARLPVSVDTRLKQRLQDGVANLDRISPRACAAATTTTDTTPTTTTQTTTTRTTTTDTTPTTTTTTPTTTTTTPTTTTPPPTTTDGGGGTTAPGASLQGPTSATTPTNGAQG